MLSFLSSFKCSAFTLSIFFTIAPPLLLFFYCFSCFSFFFIIFVQILTCCATKVLSLFDPLSFSLPTFHSSLIFCLTFRTNSLSLSSWPFSLFFFSTRLLYLLFVYSTVLYVGIFMVFIHYSPALSHISFLLNFSNNQQTYVLVHPSKYNLFDRLSKNFREFIPSSPFSPTCVHPVLPLSAKSYLLHPFRLTSVRSVLPASAQSYLCPLRPTCIPTVLLPSAQSSLRPLSLTSVRSVLLASAQSYFRPLSPPCVRSVLLPSAQSSLRPLSLPSVR